MATNGRNRRLEPSYKQHTAVDDQIGVVLDVDGHHRRGQRRPGARKPSTRSRRRPARRIRTVTADAGYAYAKVYGGLERRGIEAVIPAKAEPIRSPVPLRRFRYDARHDIVKCPRGRSCGRTGRSSTAASSIPAPRTASALRPRRALPLPGAGEQGRS